MSSQNENQSNDRRREVLAQELNNLLREKHQLALDNAKLQDSQRPR